jgi:histidine triad (HIT) family protein
MTDSTAGGEHDHDRHDDVICQIVAGDLDAAVVHRDDRLIAFLDHRPVFKGHVLIAPVHHVDNLLTLPEDLMQPMLGLARRMSLAVIDGLGATGTFSAINTIVSQSIPHLHFHVVPRTKGDGLRGFFWPRTRYAAGEAADYAARIATALALVDSDDA